MNILILEDNPERSQAFRKTLIGAKVTIVETVEEAKRLLSTLDAKPDVFFIDHDLGGKTFVPSGPGTGYEVAQWLAENPQFKPESILIHSLNPDGQKAISSVLPEAIVAPYAWRLCDIEDGRIIYHQPYIIGE